MGKSSAFARIRRDVIELTLNIPFGRVATYRELGATLAVMPRHVAYILASLKADESEVVPWYRVVGAEGELIPLERDRERALLQRRLLRAEGVEVTRDGKVAKLPSVAWVFATWPGHT